MKKNTSHSLSPSAPSIVAEPKTSETVVGAVKVDGELYFTIGAFALLTNRSAQTVRRYLKNGNRIRKLKMIRVVDRPLIPVAELTEYPFTVSGRNSTEIYHYDTSGKVRES